jgi:hypothetical protein
MLYNITPPNTEEQIYRHLDKLKTIIEGTDNTITSIGIYDIIPEDNTNTNTNTNTCRPFPIRTYVNTFIYAQKIQQLLFSINKTHISIIVYRSVKIDDTYDSITHDLETHIRDFSNIVLVGNSANKELIQTNELIRHVKTYFGEKINIGCVLLHNRPKEYELCLQRIELGTTFFVSQIVVSPEQIQAFLHNNTQIRVPIYYTIVPIPNEKTRNMIRWLCRDNSLHISEDYLTNLKQASIPLICVESITHISPANMIQFIQQLLLPL